MATPEPAHSRLGASGAYRWMACTASVKASAGIPKQTSIYAAEGHAAHTVAEQCLRQDLDAAHFIGKQITTEEDAVITVTDEMAEAVQVYLDEVRATHKALPGSILLIEHKFHLASIHADMFGTADAVIIQPFGKMVVIDYKHGAGKYVQVEENPQAMFYGLGALFHPKAAGCEEVELVIVQPRAMGAPVRRWETTPERLVRFGEELKQKAEEALGPSPVFKAGDHCRWCPYAPHCAELRANTTRLTRVPDPAFTPVAPPLACVPVSPCMLKPEELGRVLAFADVIEGWLTSVREHVHGMLQSGQRVPGYKLVEGRATWKWADEQILVDRLPADVLYERKMRGPAGVEKELKARGLDPKQLSDLITETKGVSIAPEADPRPALHRDPGFTPVA